VELDVTLLRELFRTLQGFRALYETEGVDTITSRGGDELCLWDIDYLYREAMIRLPARQRQAIHFCLVEGRREEDVARMMGIAPTNPVSMYATNGLRKLIELIGSGALPYYQRPVEVAL
jgi:DNA-directed RNA polymerase specialized sigma24 family protein